MTSQFLIILSPFCQSQDLKVYLKKFCLSPEEKKNIFYQIVQAVKKCHDMNIVHRDIKLNNVIIDKNLNTNLIDFGYSMMVPDPNNMEVIKYCGTPLYMAPEIISRKIHDRKVYFVFDIYYNIILLII